jgi:peroxiredoxin
MNRTNRLPNYPASAICALAFAALSACGSHTGEVQPDPAHSVLSIGSPAPDFSLPGVDGKTHTLAEYAGAKVLAIVFDCNHCPQSHLYESRIRKLYNDYHDKGVALVAVSPNNPASVPYSELAWSDSNDSLIEMQTRATDRHIEYPYLYDGDAQTLTAKLGAVATPQVFVFDQSRKLRYQGRIDDNERADQVKSQDARNAIDALLAGKPVDVATTPVSGCATRWNPTTPVEDPETTKINAEPVAVTMTTPEILKKLRGNGTGKLLLVNFWATWCGPCVAEMPNMEAAYKKYHGKGFDIIGVSLDKNDEAITKFTEARKLPWPSINVADSEKLADRYGVNAIPFPVLVDAQGRVVSLRARGPELDRLLEKMLGEKK